ALSKANVFTAASFANLASDLRSAHISVSGYAVGWQQNAALLAALANHTGGVFAIDEPAGQMAVATGRMLADSTHANGLWPVEGKFSANVSAVYPQSVPPLRSDRDSILVGTFKQPGPVDATVSGTLNGRPVQLDFHAAAEKSSDDFVFLPRLV